MQITLSDVRVDGRREPVLEEMDLELGTGECVLVAGEPGHGHTALALVATGRFAPSSGRVDLVPGPGDDDGATRSARSDAALLRRLTAVVDVPGISAPDEALTVADVVAEGLALAGRRSLPPDVSAWLAAHGLAGDRRRRLDAMPGVVRTAILAALAAEAPDVRFLVLNLPDRHGGEASGWWQVGLSLAREGYGVLVQCSRASARDLGADLPPARGASLHEPPVVALRARPEPAAAPADAAGAAAPADAAGAAAPADAAGAAAPADAAEPVEPAEPAAPAETPTETPAETPEETR